MAVLGMTKFCRSRSKADIGRGRKIIKTRVASSRISRCSSSSHTFQLSIHSSIFFCSSNTLPQKAINMKLFTSIVAVVTMVSSVEACKCYGTNGPANESTRLCCTEAKGTLSTGSGTDCPIGTILNQIETFNNCCINNGDASNCEAFA